MRLHRRVRPTLRSPAMWPAIIGLLWFTAYPVLASLYYSFCDYSLLQPPVFTGLDNYRGLMNDPVFWKVLRNTAYYASLSLPLGLMLAMALAVCRSA